MSDEPTEKPRTVLELLLLIVRENGLIVLALLSLGWQAYVLVQYSSMQQEGWRTTVDGLKTEVVQNRQLMVEALSQLTTTLVRHEEISRTSQKILADTEEEILQFRDACRREPLTAEKRAPKP